MESAFSLCRGEVIEIDDLPPRLRDPNGASKIDPAASLEQARDQFERDYVKRLLERYAGNVTRAATAADIHRSTFQRILQKHAILAEEFRQVSQ